MTKHTFTTIYVAKRPADVPGGTTISMFETESAATRWAGDEGTVASDHSQGLRAAQFGDTIFSVEVEFNGGSDIGHYNDPAIALADVRDITGGDGSPDDIEAFNLANHPTRVLHVTKHHLGA